MRAVVAGGLLYQHDAKKMKSGIAGPMSDAALLDAGTLRLVRHLGRLSVDHHELTIVTQCSFDRLAALERLVRAWDGVVCCAFLLSDCRDDAQGEMDTAVMDRTLSELHAALPQRLVVDVFRRSSDDSSKPYPINSLRNVALASAAEMGVPLALIVDVDCVPSAGAHAALVGVPERAAALRRLCCDDGDALVLPCVEMDALPAEAPRVEDVKAAIRAGSGHPFMLDRWPQGHRATRFAQWASSSEEARCFLGPLRYEEFFEPYVIVALCLCPRFDEVLTGYGRNKALHALQVDSRRVSLRIRPSLIF